MRVPVVLWILFLSSALVLSSAVVGSGNTERKTSAETSGEDGTACPLVVLSTSLGDITVELFSDKAPLTVQNFLKYVDEGFYAGTVFHRVIPGFVIQGGGLTGEMKPKPTRPPIKNEADKGASNVRGTLAMARTKEADSATSQFFINLANNTALDHGRGSDGYAVFGRVVEGMDVVEKISAVRTGNRDFHRHVPVELIVIRAANRKSR